MSRAFYHPAPKKKRKKAFAQRVALEARASWRVVLIDAEPLRREARRECLGARREVEEMEARLRRNDEVDGPAFRSWLHQELGVLMTESRDALTALQGLEDLIREVHLFAVHKGVSLFQAYRRVKLRREGNPDPRDREDEDRSSAGNPFGGDDSDFDPFPGPDGIDYDNMSEGERVAFEAFYDVMSDVFEDETGARPPGFEEMREGLKARSASARPVGGDVKACYRAIVRILHPDRGGAFTPREQELWHQTQEAYARRDLGALQIILARCESGEDSAGLEQVGSLWLLREMTRQARSRLRTLQMELEQARRSNPAWDFTRISAKKKRALREKAERELRRELAEALHTRREYERQIADWERKLQAKKRPAPSKPKKMRVVSVQTEMFPF